MSTKPPNQPPHPPILPTYPDLASRVALITGIGQVGSPTSPTWGNGAATALILAHNKTKIHGCDLSLAAAERTKSRILALYPEAEITVSSADVTNTASVRAFVQEAVDLHGRIDILVNNVGMTAPGSPSTMSEATWAAQLELNLTSVYRTCAAVLPVMESQSPPGGSIINNASITALRYIGKPQIAYASAKAAVLQFTRATGAMYADKGIRCNAVVPGLMYTPLVENLAESEDAAEREVARRICAHNVPMGWMGSGEDVGNAVAWLASGVSRYVTSQAVVVDGGVTESTGTGFGSKL